MITYAATTNEGVPYCYPCSQLRHQARTGTCGFGLQIGWGVDPRDLVRMEHVPLTTLVRCPDCGAEAHEPMQVSLERTYRLDARRHFRSRFRHPRHARGH